MFTPQRKALPSVSFTPRSEARVTVSNSILVGKGKGVAFADAPPPPLDSLTDELDKTAVDVDTGSMSDWRKFKKAGLLDVATMERKDREALVEKASRLQSEIFDYQHSMGLLLIEKKEWSSKYDELRQDLAETEEIFKRAQTAHLISLSEVETRRENLKKALTAEKQNVASLKKAFIEANEEHAQIKLASHQKLADANALMHGIEAKSLELQKNLDVTEVKLSEVSRKSLELEMRMHEVEARERLLQTEQLSLVTEQEMHEATSQKESEGLCKWKQKLQESEERLGKECALINVKEEKINEHDETMKLKEKDLEEMKKKIDLSSLVLKEREDDANMRLADVEEKEKEADFTRSLLAKKQGELHQMEENLRGREKMEIQQILDGQRAILEKKSEHFELELEEKRRSLHNEVRSKMDVLERKDVEINHEKGKLVKQEQALEKKMLRAKEKEVDLDQKIKILKAEDKDLKADEKRQQGDRQKMLAERESLKSLINEIEEIRTENTRSELQIHEERDRLQIMKEERTEHVRLQCQLMQEIESYRLQNKVVTNEHDDLKQEKARFETDWEVLYEKRAEISKELIDLEEERTKLEILEKTEDERLSKEKNELLIWTQRELDNIKKEKELFASTNQNDQRALSEMAQSEHEQLLQDIELQRKNLESRLQNSQEDLERNLRERELAFEQEKEREQKEIFCLKETVQKEMEQLSSDRHELEKGKEFVSLNRKQLMADHDEIRQDIDKLNILSKKLKIQREQLIKDRARFLAYVDKHKSCGKCGHPVEEFVVHDLQLPEDFREPDPLSKLDDESLKNFQGTPVPSDLGSSKTGGSMSWLRSCSARIFKLSPMKKIGHGSPVAMELLAAPINTDLQTKKPSALVDDVKISDIANEPQPSLCNENFSSSDIIRGVENDDYNILDSKVEEVSKDSKRPGRRKEKQKNEMESKSGLHRTRSVKAAVEEAKSFLGKTAEESDHDVLDDSSSLNEVARNVRKRQRMGSSKVSISGQNADDSETDSVTARRQHKRRQKVDPVQTQGEKRYNLRRHTAAGKASASHVSANPRTVKKKENDEASAGKAVQITEARLGPSSVDDENGRTTELTQVTTVRTIEVTKDRVVRFETLTTGEDNTSMEKSVTVGGLGEEVNCSSVHEDEDGDTIYEEDEYDDEEQQEPASMGKKIWTFFTT